MKASLRAIAVACGALLGGSCSGTGIPSAASPCTALVELCCEPDSALSAMAVERGLEALRITKEDRFDLDRGLSRARCFLATHAGADAWASLPCTAWCSWQYVNQAKYGAEFNKRLGWRRRQSVKMV